MAASVQRCAALLLVFVMAAPFVLATEKSAVAQTADLVIVARLTGVWSFPWFDGWHIRGTLKVTRVLWGLRYQETGCSIGSSVASARSGRIRMSRQLRTSKVYGSSIT